MSTFALFDLGMNVTEMFDRALSQLRYHGTDGEFVLNVPSSTEDMGELVLWCAENGVRLNASPLCPIGTASLTPARDMTAGN